MHTGEFFFDGQRDGEEVLAVWRRHPWTMAKPALVVLILSLSVIASFRYLGASTVTSLLLGAWLAVVPAVCGYTWFRWWNDIYLLTNLRLIDIDQKKLFHRAVAEAPLSNVQDVSFELKGIMPTILNYGKVFVQTASVTTEIAVEDVMDPQSVQQAILRAAERARSGKTVKTTPPGSISKSRTQLG